MLNFVKSRILSRFRREEKGVAAVEFALLAPFLAALLIGSAEVTHLIWANGRLNAATAAVGNVLTQERTIDDASFKEILDATPRIVRPYQNDSLKFQVVSVVSCREDGKTAPTYVISWSRKWDSTGVVKGDHNARTRLTNTDLAPLLNNIVLPLGDSMIIVRGQFTYKNNIAILGKNVVPTSLAMSKYVTYQPRAGNRIRYTGVEEPQLTCAGLL